MSAGLPSVSIAKLVWTHRLDSGSQRRPAAPNRRVSASVDVKAHNGTSAYQSVACQSRRSDVASTASALAREKLPIASCRPRKAMLP